MTATARAVLNFPVIQRLSARRKFLHGEQGFDQPRCVETPWKSWKTRKTGHSGVHNEQPHDTFARVGARDAIPVHVINKEIGRGV